MTLPLTPKQEAVWRYIKACERSPTYREMERDLKCGVGRLNDVVVGLRARGYVTWKPGKARSLVALDPNLDLAAVPTEQLEAELARRAG